MGVNASGQARLRPLHGTHSDDAVFLTAREAAGFLRLSEITLGRWRLEGYGPPHHKFGRRVVYSRRDLIEWAHSQRRLSTSER
jgi:hypothetical protein